MPPPVLDYIHLQHKRWGKRGGTEGRHRHGMRELRRPSPQLHRRPGQQVGNLVFTSPIPGACCSVLEVRIVRALSASHACWICVIQRTMFCKQTGRYGLSSTATVLYCRVQLQLGSLLVAKGRDSGDKATIQQRMRYRSVHSRRSDIELAVRRVMAHKFSLGVLDPPAKVPFSRIPSSVIGSPPHLLKAVQAAQRGPPPSPFSTLL